MRRAAMLLAMGMGLACLAGCAQSGAAAPGAPCTVVSPEGASFAEALAAREVRRYVYLATGRLPALAEGAARPPDGGDLIVVASKGRPLLGAVAAEGALKAAIDALPAEGYLLKSTGRPGRRVLLVAGGDAAGTLYGAYRLAERLGVRFYLHGDVVPDGRAALDLAGFDEQAKPLFATRGIQPFHDFPEGPDWWSTDDYLAIVSQLAKMRMNFLGLHTYPEGGPNAEPTVWIGLDDEIGEGGAVRASYPSSYQNTLRGNWGYQAKKTGDFAFGGSQLFDRDAYGADVMADLCPQPATPEAQNELFGRTGAMLDAAFRHARRLGVRTCVGTETPLAVPAAVRERLKAAGKDAKDPAVVQALYAGVFQRIAKTYPLDYYWMWTPEGWTWGDVSKEQIEATLADLRAAVAAAKQVGAPFTLATCGWVLGPQNDRALFDQTLPKDMPMSCINRQVGKSPVEPGFQNVKGRPTWAIPWLEDDPNLLQPQLWAGRMRKDAQDALRYGCTGLLGIHWRTRVLGPNVAALARAAWDQAGWAALPAGPGAPDQAEGPAGQDNTAAFPSNQITGADDPALYQTVRYNVSAYHLRVPNGTRTVTLKFCEPHYGEAGKRVFGVRLQGKAVIETLDIFAKVGKNKALDYTFKNVEVTDGWLHVQFVYQVEMPCIAALVVEGPGFAKKINCGGPAYKDYAADWKATTPDFGPNPRYAAVGDFYRDWAASEFGPEVGDDAARIFERIDGRLPEPSGWIDGPGGLGPDPAPWDKAREAYAFAEAFAALRPRVRGAGNLERFDYWMHQFRYMAATAHLRCTWAEFNKAMDQVKAEKDAEKKKELARTVALPLRKQLVERVGEAYGLLLATVSNSGEMGTVANWEQHIFPGLLDSPGKALAEALGEALPADALPPKDYAGPTRVFVPTVRTAVASGETLHLKAIVLAARPPSRAVLRWRPMGEGEFRDVPLAHLARGVWTAEVKPDGDLEYYVEVAPEDGEAVRWPATAPARGQTVVVTPAGD